MYSTCIQNWTTLASAFPEMFCANQNLNGSRHLTTLLSGWFVIRGLALATINLTIKLEVSNSTCYDEMQYKMWKMWVLVCAYALSIPVEHRPQTTRLHPALSCDAVSIFLQLNLKPAVHISLSRSLFHVFLGRHLSLWPCGVHCSTCLAMLSSLILSVWPIQFHFLLLSWSRTGSSFVFFHSSLLVILSGHVHI